MLEDIAFVGEITSFEFLNHEKYEFRELLAEIRGLSNLRLLDLIDCSTLGVFPCNMILSLTTMANASYMV